MILFHLPDLWIPDTGRCEVLEGSAAKSETVASQRVGKTPSQ